MSKSKQYPTREYLTECFEFREVSDEHSERNIHLFWRVRPLSHFKNGHCMNSWNARFSGTRAGGSCGNSGGHFVRRIKIARQSYLEHRCTYIALVDSDFFNPTDVEIDHWDRNPFNNSLSNLRVSTNTQNGCNVSIRVDNTSGYKGVSWVAKRRNWCATIQVGKKWKYLGSFDDPIEAALVRDKAARELHGEFAVLNFPNGVNSPLSV